jgi:kynurenine formamidase
MNTLTYSRVISLSHVIHEQIPCWAGDPPIELTTVAELATEGYQLRKLTIGEHSATHINAPASFYQRGIGIDAYSPESLITAAIVIDIRDRVLHNPDYILTLSDITLWEKQHGTIAAGSLVLLNTGWEIRWHDPTEFFNVDRAGTAHFPGFGLEAVEFLLEQRQIAGIGIDTHGVDRGNDATFAVNRLVLSQPRIVLENLANLGQLPAVGTTIVIGVLPLQGGTGSPASVLALLP